MTADVSLSPETPETPEGPETVETVERWGVFELPLPPASAPASDPASGVDAEVVFQHGPHGERRFFATPFVDDAGRRLVRFMPDAEGPWRYHGAGTGGGFHCTPPGAGNHGPVRARGSRFRHADGRPFHPFGTTLAEAGPDTRRALAAGPFNRVRLRCAPELPLGRLEEQVRGLLDLGIEAEVPLLGRDVAGTVPRLAAYRNVWWCAPPDPDVLAAIREHDHGRHLLTVHGDAPPGPGGLGGAPVTDWGAPWITHASVRHEETRAVSALVADLAKPVILDDCGAEGDAPAPADSLTARELVSRIWEGVCQGGYVTHGEAYGARPWRTHGGAPRGESAPRIAFLREVLADAPGDLRHNPAYYDASTVEAPGTFCLQYLGPHRFPVRRFRPGAGIWQVEVIDSWNMTIGAPFTVRADAGAEEFGVELPAEPYHAVRLRRVPGA
ncbi:DUF5605 domain-containing protein [Streptomyces sp. B6B3]|uniref:DUF5605 domain-containing protein n=1 Tax=Streptomyces sp. B6B3 TaxID=3153570 RepID=UPI00325F0C99